MFCAARKGTGWGSLRGRKATGSDGPALARMGGMLPFDPAAIRVIDLEQPRQAGDPIAAGHVPPGYSYLLHRHHEPNPGTPGAAPPGS